MYVYIYIYIWLFLLCVFTREQLHDIGHLAKAVTFAMAWLAMTWQGMEWHAMACRAMPWHPMPWPRSRPLPDGGIRIAFLG